MAIWNPDPSWNPIEDINEGNEIVGGDGFLFSDQNKIVENLLYLYKRTTQQNVRVGNVVTLVGASSTDASVSIVTRPVDPLIPTGDLYLDFTFTIPKSVDAVCTSAPTSGAISYTLTHDTDKTFTSIQLSSVTLTVPAAFHGYFAGVNFRVRALGTTLSFINNSGFPLKLMLRGAPTESYTLTAGKSVLAVLNCDGINVYCNLIEV